MYRPDDHAVLVVGAFMSGSLGKTPEAPSDAMPDPATRQQTPTISNLQSTLVALWVTLAGWVHAAPNHHAVD
jgi:hypothetical protein